ncbi:MAG: DHH family phosphoesterase [Anaerolineae bacterium]|nr:DHH family phosphoesterase [Anaerolineae bacterium]
MSSNLEDAAHLLANSQRPLLIAHPRPDGDTIGSVLALRLALLELGKAPLVACVHPAPDTMRYLPGVEAFLVDVAGDADIDLVVAVDMSDLKRTGGIYKEAWRDRYPLLVVDHHATNDAFGDVNFVMPDAAATALPMIQLIEALGVRLRPDMATCLLVAVLTDTRGLRTANVDPELLEFVGRLVAAGGDYQKVMQKTLDAVPYQQMRAWGVALQRLQLEDHLAWTTFPLDAKHALGIADHDDMDLGNLLSRIREAHIIATFTAMEDGTVKISFRARPGFNVAEIARSLGGGGHLLASGCSVAGSLATVVDHVLPRLREVLAGGTAADS